MIPGITLPSDYARLALKAAPWVLIVGLVVGLLVTRSTLATARAEYRALTTEIARKTAEAQAADVAHARAVEAVQTKTTQEVSHAYQADLAALRSRYDSLRASTAKGGGGAKSVPGPAPIPSGPDAAGACEDTQLMFDAQADALQLTAIQQLIRDLGMYEEPR